jgi:hypothetical protein
VSRTARISGRRPIAGWACRKRRRPFRVAPSRSRSVRLRRSSLVILQRIPLSYRDGRMSCCYPPMLIR